MAQNFYTIITSIGKNKLTNATISSKKITFESIALGDGNGKYYEPVESQTSLRREVWRGDLNTVELDVSNPNWVVLEVVVPANVGGFMVRELGVFDSEGDLIAIGKYPETYKPLTSDGSAKDLYIRMIIEVSNAESVEITVDPSIALVTQKEYKKHLDGVMPHKFKNHKENKTYRFGFQVNSEGNPEIIYEEVM